MKKGTIGSLVHHCFARNVINAKQIEPAAQLQIETAVGRVNAQGSNLATGDVKNFQRFSVCILDANHVSLGGDDWSISVFRTKVSEHGDQIRMLHLSGVHSEGNDEKNYKE